MKEWEHASPSSQSVLRGRALRDERTRQLAARLARERTVAVVELREGLEIRTFAHVGRIELGNLVITVEPKLGANDLLDLLRYAFGLRDLDLFDSTTFATTGTVLQDLLVRQLHLEVRELVHRGLVRRYVASTEALASPRGRIDMGLLARAAGRAEATLPCRHYPRSSDHLLHAVLLSGLHLATRITQDTQLRSGISRLAAVLSDLVRPVPLTLDTFLRARHQLNRLFAAYEPALHLVELLFASSAIDLPEEGDLQLRGFLFDMNRFFEALLGRFLHEHLNEYELKQQRTLRGALRYIVDPTPKRRPPPQLRPDFAVLDRGRVIALLDAKYRDLWEHKLPREMLYQLALYALTQPTGATAAILYPTVSVAAREAVIEVRDPIDGIGRAYVALRPVILPRLAAAVRSDGTASRLAHELAFGSALSSAPR